MSPHGAGTSRVWSCPNTSPARGRGRELIMSFLYLSRKRERSLRTPGAREYSLESSPRARSAILRVILESAERESGIQRMLVRSYDEFLAMHSWIPSFEGMTRAGFGVLAQVLENVVE